MNRELFELEKEILLKECKINLINRKIVLLRTKSEPGATDYSKVMVQSSHSTDLQSKIIDKIITLEKELGYCVTELVNLKQDVQDKYNIFKRFNDYDQQIYIEKKLWKWSNNEISMKHNGITKRSINRIIRKMNINI